MTRLRMAFLLVFSSAWLYAFPSRVDSMTRVVEKTWLSNASLAKGLIKQFQDSGWNGERFNREYVADYLYASIDYMHGKSDSLLAVSIHHILSEQASELSIQDKALLHLALSFSHTASSRYAESFRDGLSALAMFEETGDTIFMVKTLSILGSICTYIKNYQIAEEYYEKALTLVKPGQFDYYQILLNRSKNFFYTRPFQETIDSMSALFSPIESFGDSALMTIAYLNAASCLIMQENQEMAGHYYRRAMEVSRNIENNKIQFTLYQGLGSYYFYEGNIEKAFDFFQKSKQIAEEDRNTEQLSYSLYNLGFIYDECGKQDSALFYLKEYIELSHEMLRNSGTMDVYQAYVSATLESAHNKLTIAGQEIALKNKSLIILIVVIVAVTVMGGGMFVFFQQRRRQQAIIEAMERKKLEKQIEQEQKIKQLQEKRHKENLEAKARELTSYSLLLANKNQILQQIAALNRQLPEKTPEVAEISRIIKNNLNVDGAWKDFMLHFQKVHPDFFQRIKSVSPLHPLTENELRLCAYFRIGMSAKQIASILNVSPESVRICRYRLKKKFGLSEEENLDDFIRNV